MRLCCNYAAAVVMFCGSIVSPVVVHKFASTGGRYYYYYYYYQRVKIPRAETLRLLF